MDNTENRSKVGDPNEKDTSDQHSIGSDTEPDNKSEETSDDKHDVKWVHGKDLSLDKMKEKLFEFKSEVEKLLESQKQQLANLKSSISDLKG